MRVGGERADLLGFLLADEMIADGVLVDRVTQAGDTVTVAYVVPSGPHSLDELRGRIEARWPGDAAPAAWVTVTSLPRTDDGAVDTAALADLEVLDPEVARRWEERLGECSGIDQVAVVRVAAPVEDGERHHLADLVPGWPVRGSAAAAAEQDATTPEAAPAPPSAAPPAEVHGPPLDRPRLPPTLADALLRTAERHPERGILYLDAGGGEDFQSYQRLVAEARDLLAGLQGLDLEPGDPVLLQLPRRRDFLTAFWACLLGGLVPVPAAVSTSYEAGSSGLQRLVNAWSLLDGPPVLTDETLAPQLTAAANRPRPEGWTVAVVGELATGGQTAEPHRADPESIALMLMTSGSTGKPKLVTHTHRGLLYREAATAELVGWGPEDKSLNWLTLDHVGSLVDFHLRDVFLGAEQVQAPTEAVLEDPLRWMDWIDRHRATVTWAPHFAYALLAERAAEVANRSWDLSCLRIALNGGEAIVPRTARRCLELLREYGLPADALQPVWGMSETSSGATYAHFTLEDSTDGDRFVEVGPPIPGMSLRVVGEDQRVVPEGVAGQLQVKGPMVTPGYHRRPELQREVFTRDGWFRTGDRAVIRAGRLTLTGREADFLVIHGLNYYSHEIESVVEQVPGVQASYTAAVGVREPGAETDKLALFLHTPLRGEARRELLDRIRARVLEQTGLHAEHILPLERQEIPKTAIGKIQRSRLKRMFEGGELDGAIRDADLLLANSNTLADHFFERVWQARRAWPGALPAGPVVVLGEASGLAAALVTALSDRGVAAQAVDPADADALKRALAAPGTDGDGPLGVVDLRGCDDDDAGGEVEEAARLLALLRALPGEEERDGADSEAGPRPRVRLWVVARGAQVVGDESPTLARTPVPALVRTADREMAWLTATHVDLDEAPRETQVSRLLVELAAPGRDPEVALRGKTRHVPRLARAGLGDRPPRPLPFRDGGVYVLAGGLGGIGRLVARHLLQRHAAHVLLLGSTPLDEDGDGAGRRAALDELATLGGEVAYRATDLADLTALKQAVEDAVAPWGGRIDGVIHLASRFREVPVLEETQAGVAAMLRPKALGARNLAALVDGSDALFLAFSSVNSFFGGATVGAYAAANRYLESFCHDLRSRHGGPVVCQAWSMWDEVGMSRGFEMKELSRASGFSVLPPDQGVASLLAGLASGREELIIGLDAANPNMLPYVVDAAGLPLRRLCAFHTGPGTAQLPPPVADRFGTAVGCELRPVDELPRDDDGAVDRRRLAILGSGAAEAATDRAASELEKRLAGIFQEVLGASTVGVADNFFHLGGHSILATQLLGRLQRELGVEVPAARFLAGPTVAQLAAEIEAGGDGATAETGPVAAGPDELPRIVPDPAGRHQPFPLTEIQQAYWIGSSEDFELGDVSMQFYQEIDAADLDAERLERAWNRLVQRHDALRAVVLPEGRAQTLEEVPEVRFEVDDLRHLGEGEANRRLADTRQRMSSQEFPLDRWPWFEIRLSRLGDGRSRIHFSSAVIHLDGGSFFLLMSEWGRLYQEPSTSLPALEPSYRDYALALEELRETEAYRRSLEYWRERVTSLPPAPELPLLTNPSALTDYSFTHRSRDLPAERWQRIQAVAQRLGISRSAALLTAYAAVLAAWSGSPRLTINVTLFNRLPLHPQIDEILGDFTSMALVAVEEDPEDSFETLARRVQDRLWSDLEHRLVSGVAVQRELARVRGEHATSLTPIVFTSAIDLEMGGARSPSQAMARLGKNVFHVSQTPQVLLDFQLFEEDGGLRCVWDAVEDAFPPGLLDDMWRALGELLEELTHEDGWRRRPRLLPEAQRERRAAVNDTEAPASEALLHTLFAERAEQRPDHPAVIASDRTLTYGEVAARSAAVAAWLRRRRVSRGSLVAVAMEKGWEQVVAVLGVLRAGAAYLPLDPGLPRERRFFLLANAEVELVLTQERLAGDLEWPQGVERLAVDRLEPADGEPPREDDAAPVRPEDLAYVIFTSGSTGVPKGVMIDHRGAVNTILDVNRRFQVGPADRVLALSELNFDLSVYDVFGTLAAGATLVMPPPGSQRDPGAWLTRMRQHGVTVWNSVPALMELLVELTEGRGDELPDSLRLALLSGDWIPVRLPDRLRALADGCRVVSLGGATEASIWSILYPIGEVDPAWKSIPYGRPMDRQRFHVLDAAMEPCPDWVPGMLYIGGAGLALGYWRDDEKTAASFVTHPRTGERLYRTGDLGRWLPDGHIEFLGRDDTQVKIHGHRIELGEIEAALQQHPAVAAAVATAVGESQRDRRLVAWVVAEEGLAVDGGDLHDHLAAKLPEYMVPAAFVPLENLPLTATGKVDRSALKPPGEIDAEAKAAYVEPRTTLEETLAALWRDLLHVERLGVHDNLLHLGGNSLTAIMAVSRIRDETGVELPLRRLLSGRPTVAVLAEAVEAADADGRGGVDLPRVAPLPEERHDPFPLHAIQEAYWIGRRDAFELGNVAAYFYLEVEVPELDVDRLEVAWRRVVERHAMLRTVILGDGRQQVLAEVPPYRVEALDLSGAPADEAEDRLQQVRHHMEQQVMDPARWPLFELRVTHLGAASHLHFGLDLLVADAWSVQILFRDLEYFYTGRGDELEPLELTFRDYLFAELRLQDSELYRRSEGYWLARLDDLPPAPDLPLVKELSQVREPRFVRRRAVLEAPVWTRLVATAQEAGLTPSGLLMAAFADVLAAWSRSPRFTLNVTTFNRLPLHPQVDDVVGDFTSLTLLQIDASAGAGFAERAARLQEQLFEDLEHRYVSGVHLLREMARRQGLGPRALAPIVFTSLLGRYEEGGDDTAFLPLSGELVHASSQTPQVWLDHQVIELHGGLAFTWDVVEEILPPGLLDAMFDTYVDLLHGLAEPGEAGVGAWRSPVLPAPPQEQIGMRRAANDTAADLPAGPLHGPFTERAAESQERPAVLFGDTTVSYGELDRRSRHIAGWLTARGAGPDRLVAIVMEKGWEQVAAVLGVLRAGAAYLPVAADLPRRRRELLLESGGVELVLTQSHLGTSLEWPAGIEWRAVDDTADGTAAPPAVPAAPRDADPESLAYVIFTSGSTGVPKGVMIEHRAAANTVIDVNRRFAVGPGDRVLAVSALGFDLSVYDLFGPLGAGGAVVMPPPAAERDPAAWLDLMDQHDVTVWNSAPPLLEMLVDYAEPRSLELPAGLRLVLLSGDWIPVSLPGRLRALAPGRGVEVISLGGATEASIWSIFHSVDRPDPAWRSIPYGRPLANQRFHVLGPGLEPRPTWVPGELYIAGDGLARGYWRDPVKTAASFLADPGTGERLYRTGDWGRYLPDGEIEFLGRQDLQVKIRGHRIELGEVEAVVASHPEIESAFAVVTGEGGARRLVACYVAAGSDPDHDDLRDEAAERLPDYMVPAAFVALDGVPLTSNGKVDRAELLRRAETTHAAVSGGKVAPRTSLERQLAERWSQLLGVPEVGVQDSLFDLGGNSLLAIQMLSALQQEMGVEVALRELFEDPTVAGLARVVERDAGSGEAGTATAVLPPVVPDPAARHQPFPLNEIQQAYWLGRTDDLELGNVAAHFYFEMELDTPYPERLGEAWARVVERHDMLRAVFLPDGSQRVLEETPPVEVPVHDLREMDEAEREGFLAEIRGRLSHQVLPVDRWPLFELAVSRLHGDRARLHVSFDLLIADAWSTRMLFLELARWFADPEWRPEPLHLTFRDYVTALERLPGTAAYRRAREYWNQRLPELPAAPELPLATDPARIDTPRFQRREGRLEEAAWQRLQERAAKAGVTPSGLLLAAYAEVLRTWSHRPDFTVNVTTFNRLPVHPQIDDVVGDFTSLTLVAVEPGAGDSFEARARRVQQRLWEDLDHRHVSGVEVLRDLARLHHRSPGALMPVVFTSRLFAEDEQESFLDLMGGQVVHSISQTPQVWLDKQVAQDGGDLVWTWDSVEELFPGGLVDDMFAAFGGLLETLAGEPESWLRETFDLLPEEQHRRARRVNDTAGPVPQQTLHGLVAAQAEGRPGDPAVIAPGRTLTHGELADLASRVAGWLRGHGAAPGDLVGVVMEKGWEQVVAALGVLQAGAAYLPVDPAWPEARREAILADGGVELVLTGTAWREGPEEASGRRRLGLDDAALAGLPAAGEAVAVDPGELAYVIFTSGSTGRPKGVAIEHRSAVNTIVDVNERFSVGADDRVLALSALTFDLSVYDVFGLLAAGGAVVLPDPQGLRDPGHWGELMARHGVTLWNSVPAFLELLLEHARSEPDSVPAGLRLALLSGDWLAVDLGDRLRAAVAAAGGGDVEVVSLGGATEAAIWSILHPVGAPDPEWPSVPYGRPMRNQRFHVLDGDLRQRPDWVPGDLYIAGLGLAREYWGDTTKTEASFLTHPDSGERLYRTGDLGRYRPTGDIEFLGRADFQVKVQGYRIELGEIEAVALRHPAVGAAVVVAPQAADGGPGERRLVGFVVPEVPGEAPPPDELRDFLAATLPDYMVPPTLAVLDELPLTANGKVDRRALEERAQQERTGTAGDQATATPRTPLEERLCEMWGDLLGVDRVGVHDNLFDLGGNSLLAIRLSTALREELGAEVSLRELFAQPTVAELAATVARQRTARDEAGPAEAAEALPHIQPDPENRHLPFPLNDVQQAYWVGRTQGLELGSVAAHSYTEVENVGFDLDGFQTALRRMIERHDALRTIVLPDGRQQILAEVPPYEIEVLDLRGRDAGEVERELATLRERLSHQVLPADTWPIFEVRATLLDGHRTRLHLSFDLLISDAWSSQVLFSELARVARDPAAELPALDISFRDYVLAEEGLKETETYRRSRNYWLQRLDTLPPAPELPRRPGADATNPRFVRHEDRLPRRDWDRLRKAGSKMGVTPSGLLLSLFCEVLARWSKEPRFTINLTTFNRLPLHPQVNRLMGDFTSLTLLAADRSGEESLEMRARRLQEQLWDDLDHRHFNGVAVMRELARRRGQGGTALMPVVFTSRLFRGGGFGEEVADFDYGEVVYSVSQTPQVWLDHQVVDEEDGLVWSWDVVDDLFPEGLVDKLFTAYSTLLKTLAEDPDAWQRPAPTLLPASDRRLIEEANRTASPRPSGLLHAPLMRRAEAEPEWPAVITPERTLTYGELAAGARRVGRWLREGGARTDHLVAIVMEKGWEQAVAAVGVLESGAAYLPIGADMPAERLHLLLERGEVDLVLTQSRLEDSLDWPDRLAGRLAVDRAAFDPRLDDSPLETVQGPDDLAYVIFTSGSTGEPKGVAVEHRAALNTLVDVNRRFAVGPQDRVLALSALSFDLSVYDLFGILAVGGAVVMPAASGERDPQHWRRLMEEHGVTVWNSVPALMELLLPAAGDGGDGDEDGTGIDAAASKLRLVLLSGDWIPLPLPARIQHHHPRSEVISLGGATEAAVWSIFHPVREIDPDWRSVPYGRPLANQSFAVLDDALRPRPVGVTGELYIGGAGLARGYWRDADKTAASFITHPESGERLYRTGDLGRYRPDGSIEFLGREDNQVKIQGYRIELGEIEAALAEHPAVAGAVVNAPAAAAGDGRSRRLVGYVVPALEPTDGHSGGNGDGGGPASAGKPPRRASLPAFPPIHDPMDRLLFKLERPGLRPPTAGAHTVELPGGTDDADAEALFLARRSVRRFEERPVSLDELGRWLGCLRQARLDGLPLPKLRYPSGGGLYPVQTYLAVAEGRVEGLPAGIYAYHPGEHSLLHRGDEPPGSEHHGPDNRGLVEQAAFTVFLVGRLSAVGPMYPDTARDFCVLEAGYMGQLLQQEAPASGLGLCPLGGLDFPAVRPRFGLEETDQLVYCLAGGPAAPVADLQEALDEQPPPGHADTSADGDGDLVTAPPGEEPPEVDWHARAITDPIARLEHKLRQSGLPERGAGAAEVALPAQRLAGEALAPYLRRRTCRRFLDGAVPLADLSGLLACLRSLQPEGLALPKYRYPSGGGLYPVQTYLAVKPGGVEGLDGGTYYYDPADHRLELLDPDAVLKRGLHGPVNQPIFDRSACTVFLVAKAAAVAPLYPGPADDFCLLEAGHMGQLLMEEGPGHRIGLAPLGGVDFDACRHHFHLDDDHRLVHVLEAGRIPDALPTAAELMADQEAPPPDHAAPPLAAGPEAGEPTAAAGAPAEEAGEPMEVQPAELRGFLAAKLPPYMVPPTFLVLDRLPLTANGKVDRRALPLPEQGGAAAPPRERIAPRNADERRLAELVAEVLEVDRVGIHDNFFDLGGTSVQIIQLQRLIELRLDREVDITLLFRQPTVLDLAAALAGGEDEAGMAETGQQQAQRRKERRRARRRRGDVDPAGEGA